MDTMFKSALASYINRPSSYDALQSGFGVDEPYVAERSQSARPFLAESCHSPARSPFRCSRPHFFSASDQRPPFFMEAVTRKSFILLHLVSGEPVRSH